MITKRIIEYITKKKGIDVRINGDRPHDIQIHNPMFYKRVLRNYSLGVGEGYMDGDWSCEDLEGMLRRTLETFTKSENVSFITTLQNRLFNMQTVFKSKKAIEKHYDVGNDLYQAMLDPYMQYSCGYWKDATTLEEAQLAKMDLICRKLQLQKGQKVLDIGCGFGGLMRYMRDRYGVDAVGITLSVEQQKLGKEKFGMDQIYLKDYRDITVYDQNSFDRVVSTGMFEHVGYKNHSAFFKSVRHVIKADGILLLQTVGSNVSVTRPDDWVDKYLFSGGMTPSITQLGKVWEGAWVMEDWHNFGPSHSKTLNAWDKRTKEFFKTTDRYPVRFQRMWEFYLLGCKVSFDLRALQLWQMLLSPNGIKGGLQRVS